MYRAGIDLGGTNIKAGIVDEQQHIIAEASVPTNVERPYQDIIRDMAELVKTLLKQKGIGETQLKSIGIGSPGTIDAVHGVVLYSIISGGKMSAHRAVKEVLFLSDCSFQ